MIKFYNSLTRKKEEFIPIEKYKVKMYSCGPTVYNFAHIGNLRAYIFSDLIVRTLKYFKFEVFNVMNITDVDDKTIRDSKSIKNDKLTPNEILKEFTNKYKTYFLEDLKSLNILKPIIVINATDSIKEIEFLINKLFEKGFAYISDDGIYFNLSKNKNYGKLVQINFQSQKKNISNRMIDDEYDKDSAQDFVLWKFKNEENEPSWEIEIGNNKYVGRPGWHIECSAMAYTHLGNNFDIHTGGIDLKFPHHENEICQSSCALDIDNQANFWMHNEHLLVDGKKMSKSLGNFYTLRDLNKMNFSSLALREVYLRSHYRQQLNFTLDSIKAGEVNVKKINTFYSDLKNLKPFENNENKSNRVEKIFKEKLDVFEKSLKDDLNTSIAISSVYEFIHLVNKIKKMSIDEINLSLNFLERIDKVFGLLKFDESIIPANIIKLANERKLARENKKFDLADDLRKQIELEGFILKDSKDSKEGFIIIKK